MSVLIWTQHLLGTGHLRRSLALARALAARAIDTTLATGGPPARFTVPDRVRIVQLDPVQATAGNFTDLRRADGSPWTDTARHARASVLADLVATLCPSVQVTELYPFGRRAFRHELMPAIEQVRAHGGKIVCSVRDVLAGKADPAKTAAMRDLALQHYGRILVHGDQTFLPFATTFPHADALADRLVHTGFVVDLATAPAPTRSGVLVSAGGGRVGRRLLEVAAAARPLTSLAGEAWHLVGGAALAEPDRADLAQALSQPGRVDAHLDDLPQRLASCRVSISQAGYNTVAEALMGGAPMVLVPFADGGETEQTVRASRLAELGRAVLVPADALTPQALADAVDRAIRQDCTIGSDWRFDGAAVSARLIESMLG